MGYSSTSRGQYCSMQSAAANFINNVLTKKCNFGPLFSRVGIPSQVIAMLQHAGHVFYQQTGCPANQMYYNSKYQSPNPSYYNSKYGGNWSNMFQGMNWNNMNWNNMFQGMNWNNMDWSNMFQGMDWNNMFQGMDWNNMDWSNMFQGMDWSNMFQGMDWNNLFQGMRNNQGYSSNQ